MEALISNIKEECKELREKQSWVKEHFSELLDEVNEKLDCDLPAYSKRYSEISDYKDHRNIQLWTNIGFSTEKGKIKVVKISLEDRGHKGCHWNITSERINRLKPQVVRKLIERFPEYLEELYQSIKESKDSFQETEEKLRELLEKIN